MGSVIEPDSELDNSDSESHHDDVAQEKSRIRVLYSKLGPLRYISNLDLARLWERICRRARLPLVYSQGFNPRPKIQLAAGLPLGYLSTFEIVDLWALRLLTPLTDLSEELNHQSPDGMRVIRIGEADLAQPALQSITDRSIYQVRLLERHPDDLQERLTDFSNLTACFRTRRAKQYDLRPMVDKLALTFDGSPMINMTLAISQKRGTARPDEVMDALGLNSQNYEVTRIGIELEPPYDLGI